MNKNKTNLGPDFNSKRDRTESFTEFQPMVSLRGLREPGKLPRTRPVEFTCESRISSIWGMGVSRSDEETYRNR
jgi:hypothetical protein